MNEVGVYVRERRKALKLTQEQLVARLDQVTSGRWQAGRRDIHRIEAGTRKVTDIELRYLSLALEIEACALLSGDVAAS